MIRKLVILLLLSLSFGTVTDIDGNVYETVQIGEQLWMAENLKTTKYRDGSAIPTGHSDSEWANLSSGAYAVYPTDDDEASQSTCGDDCAAVYGNLYNWYTVDDSRGVCPEGWHVPSDAEWTILTDYLGGQSDAGGKMKETGLEHWNYYSDQIILEATNESGFTGLPAGYRFSNYESMGNLGYFWSSSEDTGNYAWLRGLSSDDSYCGQNISLEKQLGYSIRCLGD